MSCNTDEKNMGKFIKDNFPGAKSWIRLAATELQERNDNTYSSLSYIDGAISQFTVKNSSPNTMPEYAFDNKDAADDLGIEVICGLNIAGMLIVISIHSKKHKKFCCFSHHIYIGKMEEMGPLDKLGGKERVSTQ